MVNLIEFRIAMDGQGNDPPNVVAVEVHGQRGGVRAQFVTEGHELYAPIVQLLGAEGYAALQALDPVIPPDETAG